MAVPGVDDLWPLRQATNITVTAAAKPAWCLADHDQELERGICRNDDLAQTYRDWLAAA